MCMYACFLLFGCPSLCFCAVHHTLITEAGVSLVYIIKVNIILVYGTSVFIVYCIDFDFFNFAYGVCL